MNIYALIATDCRTAACDTIALSSDFDTLNYRRIRLDAGCRSTVTPIAEQERLLRLMHDDFDGESFTYDVKDVTDLWIDDSRPY